MAFPADWGHYFEVTVQSAEVTGSHTDFPVYFPLSDAPSGFWSKVQSDGGDVRAALPDETLIPHEVSFIDTGNEEGSLWFKPSSIDDTTDVTVRVYYDNPDASALPVGDPNGRNAVWVNGQVGVWHLDEDSGDAIDSSGNGSHGTVNGATQGAAGQVGEAYDFDGVDDYIDFGSPSNLDLTIDLTASFWVKFHTDGDYRTVLNRGGHAADGFLVQKDNNDNIKVTGNQTVLASDSAETISADTWYHIVVRWDESSGNVRLWIDGSEDANSPLGTQDLTFSSDLNWIIGYRIDTDSQFVDGQIDNVRIYDRALSANEISTIYNNQNDPAGFMSVGSEQSVFIASTASATVEAIVSQVVGADATTTRTAPTSTASLSATSVAGDGFGASTAPSTVASAQLSALLSTGSGQRTAPVALTSAQLTPLNGTGSGKRAAPSAIAPFAMATTAATGSGTRTAPATVTPLNASLVDGTSIGQKGGTASVAQAHMTILEAGRIVGRRVSETGTNNMILQKTDRVTAVKHDARGPTDVTIDPRGRTDVDLPDVGETEVILSDAP